MLCENNSSGFFRTLTSPGRPGLPQTRIPSDPGWSWPASLIPWLGGHTRWAMFYNIFVTNNNQIREQVSLLCFNIAAFVFAVSYLLCLPGRNSVWTVEKLENCSLYRWWDEKFFRFNTSQVDKVFTTECKLFNVSRDLLGHSKRV